MKLPTLYKRSTTGKIVEWIVEIEGNKFRTTSGYSDGKKTTSAWTECLGKNTGKSNSTTDEEQALAEANAMHSLKLRQKYFESVNNIDQETFFSPMLAYELKKFRDRVKFPVYSQPKLDGVRCIIRASGMWTRKGKPLLSAPHIFRDLQEFFKKNPGSILDGELYCDKLSNDFNKIISLVRQSKPTKLDLDESEKYIEFHVYDYPSHGGKFSARNTALNSLALPKCCVIVATSLLHSTKEMEDKYEWYMEYGYEGQMIRLDAPYENKRTPSLLKDKQFVTDEYTICGIEEGKGNMSGKLGKLYFKTKAGKSFEASVNGDWSYLERLLLSKDLIGKEATIKYQNLTEEGKPRFGRVIAIRDYE